MSTARGREIVARRHELVLKQIRPLANRSRSATTLRSMGSSNAGYSAEAPEL